MHTPGEAVSLRCREYLVFLGVVKVRDLKSSLFFAERGSRQLTFAVILERPQVVLEPRHQGNMLDGSSTGKGIQHIPHHGGIDLDVLRFCRLPHPRGEKNMRGRDTRECVAKRIRLEKIRCNRPNSFVSLWIARKAIYLPIRLGCQQCCQVEAHNTRCSHD